MDRAFDDLGLHDPLSGLPTGRLDRAMTLRNGLVSLCEGRTNINDPVYRLLRAGLLNDQSIADLVPQIVRTAHDTGGALSDQMHRSLAGGPEGAAYAPPAQASQSVPLLQLVT